jgi:hypothetical protein
MAKNTRFLFCLLFLLVSSLVLQAETECPWNVVGSGGTNNAATGRVYISGTIGQTAAGPGLESGTNILFPGFWVPLTGSSHVISNQASPADLDLSAWLVGSDWVIKYSGLQNKGTIKIFSVDGHCVAEVQTNQIGGECRVPTRTFAQGVYLLRLESDNSSICRRFIYFQR